jgi:hypothetical protein
LLAVAASTRPPRVTTRTEGSATVRRNAALERASRVSRQRSLAVTCCPSASCPHGSANRLPESPIAAARPFIRATKAAALPAACSAAALQASLAEATSMAATASPTSTFSPARKPRRVPVSAAALSLTVIQSPGVVVSRTRSAVRIFTREAGARGASGALAQITCPSTATRYDGAASGKRSTGAGGAAGRGAWAASSAAAAAKARMVTRRPGGRSV